MLITNRSCAWICNCSNFYMVKKECIKFIHVFYAYGINEWKTGNGIRNFGHLENVRLFGRSISSTNRFLSERKSFSYLYILSYGLWSNLSKILKWMVTDLIYLKIISWLKLWQNEGGCFFQWATNQKLHEIPTFLIFDIWCIKNKGNWMHFSLLWNDFSWIIEMKTAMICWRYRLIALIYWAAIWA